MILRQCRPESMVPPDMDAKLGQAIERIPEYMREGLLWYLREGRRPGHFLLAVLSNDLTEACNRADEENRRALFDYVYVLNNYAPSAAWGSPERVAEWLLLGQLRRANTVSDRS